jgi:hypothetical protein
MVLAAGDASRRSWNSLVGRLIALCSGADRYVIARNEVSVTGAAPFKSALLADRARLRSIPL